MAIAGAHVQTQSELSQSTIRKNIFSMVWPATIESVLQMLVGIVATAMVGHISKEAVGAVGLANRVTQISWALFSAIGTGATVLVARAIGSKDKDQAARVAQQALVLAVIVVCVLAALVLWQAEGIMVKVFTAKDDILALSLSYLSLAVFAMPFMAIMQVCGAIMRGAGNTRTPMMVAFVVNVINVVVSYVFIYGAGLVEPMGVRGAALGAIVAQSIGAALAVTVLSRPVGGHDFAIWTRYQLHVPSVRRILGVGVPVACEHLFWQSANILLTRLIVTFGAVQLAAHQLGFTAESLSYMPSVGFGIAATAFVGQSLGAQKVRQAERYVRQLVVWSAVLTGLTASLLLFFPKIILGFLTKDVAVIELGAKYLILMALVQLPMQISGVLNGAMRGGGDTRAPMVIGGTGLWLVRLPLSYVLSLHFGLGVVGVWVAMSIDLVIRFSMTLFRYIKGPWRTMKVL